MKEEFKLLTPPLLRDTRYGGSWDDVEYRNTAVTVSEFTGAAIQKAIDSLPEGGTVCLTEGNYLISGPVRLHDGITLQGIPGKTFLTKKDGFHSPMKIDVDYGEIVVTPEDPSGFSVGDGIHIEDDKYNTCWDVTNSYIREIHDGCFLIDEYTYRDYSRERNGMISNACPVIECIECRDAVIRDLVIEGNRENNDYIDGCRAGCIYEHRVQNIVIDNVVVHNFNGEGISIQTTKDCVIRNCTVSHCSGNGIHPGTGSHRVLVENCECFDNDNDGLFICWRVIQGTFRNNRFYRNHNSGINIGHKDTDNVFTGNEIFENDRWGVHFREETYLNAPHRCVFKENVFRDNRLNIACFESDVEDVLFENNDFGMDGNEETLEHFEITSNAKVTVK